MPLSDRELEQQQLRTIVRFGSLPPVVAAAFRSARRSLAAIDATSAAEVVFSVERVRAVVNWLTRTLPPAARQELFKFAVAHRLKFVREFLAQATPRQLRRVLGVGVGDDGNLLPAPGNRPPDVDLTDLGAKDMLLTASPLLVTKRNQRQTRKTKPEELIVNTYLPDLNPVVDGVRPDVAAPFVRQVAGGASRTNRKLSGVIPRITGGESFDRVKRLVLAPLLFGAGKIRGLADAIKNSIRHEALRIKGEIEEHFVSGFPDDVAVGYVLHSRLLPTTDPLHAANHLIRFYKDDRPGSARPWSSRLIPPYRKNCVCFLTPIFDDPLDSVSGFNPEFSNQLAIRDTVALDEWFRDQRPFAQRRLVGTERWMAVAAQGEAVHSVYHYLGFDGKFLDAATLARETPAEAASRVRVVRELGRRQSELQRRAWQAHGRFQPTPDEEQQYHSDLRKELGL